ncbi:hypothetical protein ROHU_027958 [Labeo rohita]|uniref:Uncharacterized protein n=1 Tax=Labeo rohita TaxID=84645 RepID=A0A498M714_LABRO|nr:hypothetical protein ROHU_027958 [Labeo rohita]
MGQQSEERNVYWREDMMLLTCECGLLKCDISLSTCTAGYLKTCESGLVKSVTFHCLHVLQVSLSIQIALRDMQ